MNELIGKLCQASAMQQHREIEWPASLDLREWHFAPELISIYGSETFDALSLDEQKRLAFYECLNFFSLNINGERELIAGIASRLHRARTVNISPYLHHFLSEENDHMEYFGTFCMKYGGKIYSDRKMHFDREYEVGEEDFLFFAKVMIFEEIADAYNIRMSVDARLHPITRQINLMHHRDEARHLVFGRMMVKQLFEQYAPSWRAATIGAIREYLTAYISSTEREYYNPLVYRDAQICSNPDQAYNLASENFNSDASNLRRRSITESLNAFLHATGILNHA